jgi:hypothetical protein
MHTNSMDDLPELLFFTATACAYNDLIIPFLTFSFMKARKLLTLNNCSYRVQLIQVQL